ncbi:hypothetical protein GLOIN_2v1789471 [Rhizophagus clarus]|uniref:BED-type domain-containing protein n=1 Tax=Rhizophagus clarus TaxID=94130 RepID=A0A8H3L389_9GLOM|nr:hypothetical protein GLOIN_2v1789471 [Rhizophagus clarus]
MSKSSLSSRIISIAWFHFTLVKNRAQCNYYGIKYKQTGRNTTNFHKYLQRKHPNKVENETESTGKMDKFVTKEILFIISEANTPVNATAIGNKLFTLVDDIKKYKTHVLIKFLQKEVDLELDDDDLEIIRKEKDSERLKRSIGKYGIDGNGISVICQFPPKTYTLKDNDKELTQCRITEKEITLASQLEVVSEKNTGHIDYAVKALEELICITEGKLYQVVTGFAQNLVQCESVLQINKKCKADTAFKEDFDYIYRISSLKEDSEEEKELFRDMKRVIEVIVGLLKDRVDIEMELAMKKQQVQEYFKKK